MAFLSWLFGKGLAVAISKDLCIKYLGIKRQFPNESEEKLLIRVWNLWLTLNEEPIGVEDSEDKAARLEIIKEKYDGSNKLDNLLLQSKSLLDLFTDVLYIETEISINDGKIFDNVLKTFIKESQKFGLDFSKEFENTIKTVNYIGARK
ncbi:MAG: hypothetical protein ACM3YE_14435 [Bacteroidota bacterium]